MSSFIHFKQEIDDDYYALAEILDGEYCLTNDELDNVFRRLETISNKLESFERPDDMRCDEDDELEQLIEKIDSQLVEFENLQDSQSDITSTEIKDIIGY